MSKIQELRSESRLAEEVTIHVQTYTSAGDQQDPKSFQVTKTVDISTKGIQIQLDTRIPVMSTLQLRLHVKDHKKPYLLTGQVRWTYQDPANAKRHLIGFRLLDSSQTDNKEWQNYVSFRLNNKTA